MSNVHMDDELKRLQDENNRLKGAVKELAAINEISSAINSTMTVDEISRKIMDKVMMAANAREAAIHTFSEVESSLSPHTFVRGKAESVSIGKSRLDLRIVSWIAKNKKPLVINDIRRDERFRGLDLSDNPISSLLAVPLSIKGKLIGALSVFNSRKPEGFTPADIRMLGIIGVQSAQIIENARLYQEELRLRQLEGEVDAAKKIQEGFLPKKIPEISGFDVFGGSRPAKETGGDYFDFIPTGENQMVFTLGDVSGKGLPAALLMSTIQGQARLLVSRADNPVPCDILRELNSITCQLSAPAQFATMVVGRLHAGDNRIVLANGGHNFPIVVRKDGKIEELTESSVLIGMFDSCEFVECTCHLNAGDLVAIASDGIDEAFNENNEEFGLDRFKELLIENHRQSASVIYEEITQAVTTFRGKAEQSDDITLIIIKRTEV